MVADTSTVEWQALDDFEKSFEFWRHIDTANGNRALFDSIRLTEDAVEIVNGPGSPPSSDGYRQLRATWSGTGYEVLSREVNRGEEATAHLGEFGTFLLAGKFLIATQIAAAVRQRVAPELASLTAELNDMGPSPEWVEDPSRELRYPRRLLRHRSSEELWFVADARRPATGRYLAMTYEQLNTTLARGMRAAEGLTIPSTLR